MNSNLKDEPKFQAFAIPQESVLYCTVVRNDYATRSHTHLSNAHTRHACRPQSLKICERSYLLSHLAVFLITNIRQTHCVAHPVNDRSDWPLTLAAGSVQHADRRLPQAAHTMSSLSAEVRSRLISSTQTRTVCRRRTWWLSGCHKGLSARSQGAFAFPSSFCFGLIHGLFIPDRMYREASDPWRDVLGSWLYTL